MNVKQIAEDRFQSLRKITWTTRLNFYLCVFKLFLKKRNFMAPFYGWGSTASRLEPLRGGSLLFTTKFPKNSSYSFYQPRTGERLSWPWSHPAVLKSKEQSKLYISDYLCSGVGVVWLRDATSEGLVLGLPSPFLKIEKQNPNFWKESLNFVHLNVKF